MAPAQQATYDFETGIYRPPSEGGSYSLLLRFTRNCPWNRCDFCAMYKTEKFELRPPEEIMADIDAVAALVRDLQEISRQRGQGGQVTREAAIELINRNPDLNQHHGFAMVFHWLLSGGKTAFIQDANSLIMPTDRMVTVLRHLRTTFPSINRVTTYARSKTIAGKKHEELTAIREAGLDRLHVGLESGDDTVLKRVKKGVTADGHIKGGRKAMAAGFQLSEYWMPGLGGRDRWEAHAQETARVLNAINPHYIRSRPFRPLPGTPMAEAAQQGDFQILSPHEELMELQRMVEALEITSRVCFDHAGNYWTDRRGDLLFTHSYEGYQFPDEKPKVLARIQEGLTADNQTPRFLRL
ncbi:radical SAM protein [Desulfatitalea alkaliphila]|uniref:Radical SAM protein n=1 Tax=Desulfatitalea alkaliphila TaxID=2929485 RepID=A0AA41R4A1_9BACT|nr:radical SAM protein [Desulfatitalea alkaliphila]MCJ8501168.1 radical SAM protein [Desulfatitalea alkaliphila]